MGHIAPAHWLPVQLESKFLGRRTNQHVGPDIWNGEDVQ